jgi:EAL domain-containing protein (putative c-di-GMP-specific phosphodiesterase class I)
MIAEVRLAPTQGTAVAGMQWCVEGLLGQDGVARRIPVHSNPFHVGRNPTLNLVLASSNVSKLHAALISNGEILAVRDLNSTNGTYVNGRRITSDTLLKEGDFVRFADMEFRVGKEISKHADRTQETVDHGGLGVLGQFDRLINERCIIPFFQPVVAFDDKSASGHSTFGYEALARSTLKGLENPAEMFSTAARLNLEEKLSAVCRMIGVLAGRELEGQPRIFVNTHPAECLAMGVLPSLRELRVLVPTQPITLELHEATITDPRSMLQLRAQLDDLDITLAYDDFGAGQSRLIDLVQVPPDYLKFDIHMIRDIHRASPAKRQLVKTLVAMVRDFQIAPLAEGVECREEMDVCRELGFEFAQGYYFGKPKPLPAVCPLM